MHHRVRPSAQQHPARALGWKREPATGLHRRHGQAIPWPREAHGRGVEAANATQRQWIGSDTIKRWLPPVHGRSPTPQMRRLRVLTIACMLISVQAGCRLAAEEPRSTATLNPRVLELKPGQAQPLGSDDIVVGFDSVLRDSRCPTGDRCIWQGDAVARLWLQRGKAARQSFELHTSTPTRRSAFLDGWYIHLDGLTPYPVSGQATPPSVYAITIRLSRDPSDDVGVR
jgi:hypothetical protein